MKSVFVLLGLALSMSAQAEDFTGTWKAFKFFYTGEIKEARTTSHSHDLLDFSKHEIILEINSNMTYSEKLKTQGNTDRTCTGFYQIDTKNVGTIISGETTQVSFITTLPQSDDCGALAGARIDLVDYSTLVITAANWSYIYKK